MKVEMAKGPGGSKRDKYVIVHPEDAENKEKLLGTRMASSTDALRKAKILRRGRVPVSYTHLDVYKRQAHKVTEQHHGM